MNKLETHPWIIIPYGLMLAGKSKIWELLALQYGVPFYDVDDALVERLTVESITAFIEERKEFHWWDAEKAWKDFSVEEHITLKEILKNNEGSVIAPGGRLIMNPKNRELIESTQWAVKCYLEVDLEEQVRRALTLTSKQLEHRPALQDKNEIELRNFFTGMQTDRVPTYTNFAPRWMTFNTWWEGSDFWEVVMEICSKIRELD